MTKKIFYLMVLICGLSLFSSAKQILCIGSVKEYSPKKPSSVNKSSVKIKTVASKGQRPFNYFLINL